MYYTEKYVVGVDWSVDCSVVLNSITKMRKRSTKIVQMRVTNI